MFEPLSNQMLIITMLALLAIALLCHVLTRRIKNKLVVTGLLLGLAGHVWLAGLGGLAFAASGALVGLLCLLPFYISGRLGAGDVKLMAMCGAFLGPLQVAIASIASLLVGGLIGVIWFFWQFGTDDEDIGKAEGRPSSLQLAGHPVALSSAIPYALAIVAGVVFTLMAAPMIVTTLTGGMSS